MTRKDYEMIAKALKTQIEISRTYSEQDGEFAVVNIAFDLIEDLAKDNPRFDKDRFLKACGVIS